MLKILKILMIKLKKIELFIIYLTLTINFSLREMQDNL